MQSLQQECWLANMPLSHFASDLGQQIGEVERNQIADADVAAALCEFDERWKSLKTQEQAELLQLHVSQPRMTQIMNLLHLAPGIQEELLFLPRTVSGRDPIHQKLL